METLKDFLIWYNDNNVSSFLKAIQEMSDYFKVRSLDLFEEAISLPGLAMKDLSKILERYSRYLKQKMRIFTL